MYEGQWLVGTNVMQGMGTYWIKTGSVYEGQFVNGKQCGYGKLLFKDGRIYEGDFKDGQPSG